MLLQAEEQVPDEVSQADDAPVGSTPALPHPPCHACPHVGPEPRRVAGGRGGAGVAEGEEQGCEGLGVALQAGAGP